MANFNIDADKQLTYDVILACTETPGALEVDVEVFMDKVIMETYDSESQKQVRQDIKV